MFWRFRRPSRSNRLLPVGLLTALGLCGSLSASLSAAGRSFAVVVSPDVPATNLTMEEVRRVFLLKKNFWKPGLPATILLPESGSPTRSFLLKTICRTDEPGLKRLILEKLYRAEIDLAPKVVGSGKETVSFVLSSRGVVGIVPAEDSTGASVKVLRIDGKLPGEAGYPLQD